jgi:PilZ domain
MPQGIDKRRFVRFDLRLPVLYKRLGSGRGKTGVGWTRNLSMGGVCVDLDERLDPKTVLGVLFQTEHGAIEVEAEVAWASSAPGLDGGTPHGLEFMQLGPRQTQAMERLLADLRPTARSGHRLALDIGVSVIPRDRPAEVIPGRTGNASRGGALLLLPQALSAGALVTVRLQTSRGPLRLDAAVVWVDPPEKRRPGEAIRHGVQFVSLDWSTSLALGLLLTGAA